jgi:hypothetical protein
MIEEKLARDLVVRNHEAARARERGVSGQTTVTHIVKISLTSTRIETEAPYFPIIYD